MLALSFGVPLIAPPVGAMRELIEEGLGLGIERFRGRRWFPVPERELERAQRWFQRYGVWTLLLTWLPVGGDALTVVAGVMRVRFLLFLALTAAGKTARYAFLAVALDSAGLGA